MHSTNAIVASTACFQASVCHNLQLLLSKSSVAPRRHIISLDSCMRADRSDRSCRFIQNIIKKAENGTEFLRWLLSGPSGCSDPHRLLLSGANCSSLLHHCQPGNRGRRADRDGWDGVRSTDEDLVCSSWCHMGRMAPLAQRNVPFCYNLYSFWQVWVYVYGTHKTIT